MLYINWMEYHRYTVSGSVASEIDWVKARADVEPFLGNPEKKGLGLWDRSFFHTIIDRLGN